MTSLFISYSRKDIASARRLTEALKGQGLDFWIDWKGIPPTVEWWREIERGIEQADIFLFLLSPDSTKSKICRKEIKHAVKNGKRLIPVVVRDVAPKESPNELRKLNWVFLRETDKFRKSFRTLMTAIHADYEWAQTHSQLQVKALEWDRTNRENSFLLRGKELTDAELQLATNSSKGPFPTDLQRDYIFNSRRAADRQRRFITSIAIAGAIVMAALAAFGFLQAGLAEERANIALARQLTAQAQSISTKRNSKQITSVLLAIRSMQLFPTVEASRILQTYTSTIPVSSIKHGDVVNSVAFSPDGKYVVSGGDDGTQVWEVATGKKIASMTYDGFVQSVAFSPDGQFVALGRNDGVQIWEVAKGKKIASMTHDGFVQSLGFSTDGKSIVSGSFDGTARVWDSLTGREISRMTHNDFVPSVSFSSDGKYIVSGSWDGTARVWEAITGKEVARMIHDDSVQSVTFSPDGSYVVSGSFDETVTVWEALTGKEITQMKHESIVFIVAFSPDGKYVVSGSGDDSARVWDATTGEEIARMTHNDSVRSVAFTRDGNFVVSGSFDGTARVWEAITGKEVARMIHDDSVQSVAFSPDGNYVVSGSNDGTARVWVGKEEGITLKYLPGRFRISQTCDQYDATNTNCLQVIVVGYDNNTGLTGSISIPGPAYSVDISPNGKYLIFEDDENTIHLWDIVMSKEVATVSHDKPVLSVAFNPDENYVVSGSLDATARVWEAATGQELARMTHDDRVNIVAFSPDGRYVISGSDDGSARVWEATTGNEIARMTHDDPVQSIAISPDSSYVASLSRDNIIRVWEAATGKEVAQMIQKSNVFLVAFSPDSMYIESRGEIDRVWLWRAEDLITQACLRVTRNLTHDEWKLYMSDEPYQAICANLLIEPVITPTT